MFHQNYTIELMNMLYKRLQIVREKHNVKYTFLIWNLDSSLSAKDIFLID